MREVLIGITILITLVGGVGASKIARQETVNDMQKGYEPEYEYPEEGIIGDATSEYVTEEEGIIGEATSEYVTEEEVVSQEYVGNFELTAYTWTGNPCADGEYPISSHTVACNNPALWHEWIYIEGMGTYYCHDTGGMPSNVIDIYMDDYDSCIQFGRQSARVYIVR